MRWRILTLLFLTRMGMGLQFQTMGSVSEDIAAAFRLDYTSIGFMIGLFMAPGLVLALPAGFAGRYASDRLLGALGMLLLALGGLLSANAGESFTLGAGRVVAGAGFLLGTLYFTKMVADWFQGREIATAMSIFVMSWPCGIALGQVGHVWLAEMQGWPLPFLVSSVYCLAAGLGLFLLYRSPQTQTAAPLATSARLSGLEWRLILCAGLAWGIFNASYVVYLSFGPMVLEARGYSALDAAGVISVASWAMIPAGAVCGQIADRFGHRNLVLGVCGAGGIIGLMLLNQPGAGFWGSLLFGVLGMAPAGLIMALAGMALRPSQRAFGMGVFFTLYHAIMMVSPAVAGAILDATGSPAGPMRFAMLLAAGVLPCALIFALFHRAGSSQRA